MKSVLVYHDLGAPSHYRALRYLCEKQGARLQFAEFAFVKAGVKAALKANGPALRRQLWNAFVYLGLLFRLNRPGVIVLGIAPFDWRMITLIPLMWGRTVHLHTSWPYWDGSFDAMNPRFSWVRKVWRKVLSRHVSHVYFVTEAARQNYIAAGFSLRGSSVVRHSVDAAIYHCAGRSKCVAPFRVGYVGRLEDQKGIHQFLDIARTLRGTDFEFVVAGAGPALPAVQAAHELGEVTYLGQLSEQTALASLYRSLAVLLLPSRKAPRWEELFGMVIIEAAACGVYPVVSDHIGPREVVAHLGAGSVFPEADFVQRTLAFLRALPNGLDVMEACSERAAAQYAVAALSKEWAPCLAVA